ncbi:MAG: hypothetical protein QM710_01015 [Flavobacterium sp.]
MKNSFFLLSFVCIIMSSCGSIKLNAEPGQHFTKETTFTFAENNTGAVDKTETVKELKYLLAQKGFNVVSIKNASKATLFPDEILQTKDKSQILEIYSIKDQKSIYAIETDYDYYYDVFYYSYTRFSAKIIDLNTNKTVMTAYFKGDQSVKKILKDFSELLSKQIK